MHHLLFFCMLTFTKIILCAFERDRHSNYVEVKKFFPVRQQVKKWIQMVHVQIQSLFQCHKKIYNCYQG